MDELKTNVFGVLDYLFFLGMLGISTAIGIFYAVRGQKSTADVLVGGKNMGIVPVAASIMATFVSAAGILGHPGEHFLYGSQLILSNLLICLPLLTFLTGYFIVPVFYSLETCSANEYLERRFGPLIRVIACVLYCVTSLFFMGVALFAPAMALTQVTGLPAWMTIWTTGLICTFYTTIVFVVGTLVSFLTGPNDLNIMDTSLLVPLVREAVEKRQEDFKKEMFCLEKVTMLNDEGKTTR